MCFRRANNIRSSDTLAAFWAAAGILRYFLALIFKAYARERGVGEGWFVLDSVIVLYINSQTFVFELSDVTVPVHATYERSWIGMCRRVALF